MNSRNTVRRKAMRNALQLRRALAIAREEPTNAFDVANAIGMELRFMDLPSLEGMFTRTPHPLIILPSLTHRPKGRVLFTCAHEIGHFQLGHPPTVDQRLKDDDRPQPKTEDEIAADTFAASLLMPRQAVLHRLSRSDTDPETATPIQLYQAATELGVGYNTLLTHMRFGLEMVSENWHRQRNRVSPKQLREEVIGEIRNGALSIVNEHWPKVPLDLEVDDVVAVSEALTVEIAAPLNEFTTHSAWRLFSATLPGCGRIAVSGKNVNVRVARRGYCGQFKHRYFADPDIQ